MFTFQKNYNTRSRKTAFPSFPDFLPALLGKMICFFVVFRFPPAIWALGHFSLAPRFFRAAKSQCESGGYHEIICLLVDVTGLQGRKWGRTRPRRHPPKGRTVSEPQGASTGVAAEGCTRVTDALEGSKRGKPESTFGLRRKEGAAARNDWPAALRHNTGVDCWGGWGGTHTFHHEFSLQLLE